MSGHEIRFDETPWARVPLHLLEVGATDVALRVFVGLHKWRNHDTGRAWPSHATIAKYVTRSPATVRRALAELETLGFVSIVKRPTENEGKVTHDTNLYTVHYAPPVTGGSAMGGSRGSAMGEQGVVPPVSNKPEPMNIDPKNHAESVTGGVDGWLPSTKERLSEAREALQEAVKR